MNAVAGVDEAGRGPLAGPVVAACVLWPTDVEIEVDDSKKLSPVRRGLMAKEIKRHAVAWAVGIASADEIDKFNILEATMLAMKRSIVAIDPAPREVVIDGNRCPDVEIPSRAVVGGDRLVPAISAASVLAKVTRDEFMMSVHRRFPDYDFQKHKGYPTRDHLDKLNRLGPCPLHRFSFAPVARASTVNSSGR